MYMVAIFILPIKRLTVAIEIQWVNLFSYLYLDILAVIEDIELKVVSTGGSVALRRVLLRGRVMSTATGLPMRLIVLIRGVPFRSTSILVNLGIFTPTALCGRGFQKGII